VLPIVSRSSSAVRDAGAEQEDVDMGLLDRLFGRHRRDDYGYQQQYGEPQQYSPPPPSGRGGQLSDEQAIERYRYLLRTAPPDQIEQAHAEAFEQLTPDQRQQVLAQLAAAVPAGERPTSDDPRTLARVATRAEIRQPGTLERAFGGYGGSGRGYGGGYGGGYGPSFGSMVGGSLLGTIGGLVIGTAVADALFDTGAGDGGLFGGGDETANAEGSEAGQADDGGGDQAADGYGGDPNADFAGGAESTWDGGGGDFGGGDFGGGDF
jgi:hypothetical protein